MGLIVKPEQRWPEGIIPYHFLMPPKDMDIYAAATRLRGVIEACMGKWMASVNVGATYISFVEKPDLSVVDPSTVKHIKIDAKGLSGSSGRTGWSTGPIAERCMRIKVEDQKRWACIPHEIGHLLGLQHENEQNGILASHPYSKGQIPRMCLDLPADEIKKKMPPFQWSTRAKILSASEVYGEYDPASIMHYPAFDAFVWNTRPKTSAGIAADPNGVKSVTPILEELHLESNYPTDTEVIAGTWKPSAGDIATLQWRYAKTGATASAMAV
jgi:hypothetical protein